MFARKSAKLHPDTCWEVGKRRAGMSVTPPNIISLSPPTVPTKSGFLEHILGRSLSFNSSTGLCNFLLFEQTRYAPHAIT
jgi:hypothetical protein